MIGVHIVSILYEHFVNQGKYYHGMWLAGLTLAVLNRFIKMVLVISSQGHSQWRWRKPTNVNTTVAAHLSRDI